MHSQALEKVPNGKLLRIKVSYSDKIEKIQILGDFFAHPEDSIAKIEEKLTGINIDFENQRVKKMLEEVILKNNFELIGIDPEAIVRVLKKALKEK